MAAPTPLEAYVRLSAWLARNGWPVHAVNTPLMYDAYGLTDFGAHDVYLVQRLDRRQQAETLIHEAGHVLLHWHLAAEGLSREEGTVEAIAVVLTWEQWGWYERHPLADRRVAPVLESQWSATTREAYRALKDVAEGRRPPPGSARLFLATEQWIQQQWRQRAEATATVP